jgi:hypothetical protein
MFCIGLRWVVTKCMHYLVIKKVKDIVFETKYISVSCVEVTTTHQQSWASFSCLCCERLEAIAINFIFY